MLPINGGPATAWAGSPVNASARRNYAASSGSTIDALNGDASPLASQGFVAVGDESGATTARPVNKYLRPGYVFVDTTLSLVVVWDGTDWRNPVTGAVA